LSHVNPGRTIVALVLVSGALVVPAVVAPTGLTSSAHAVGSSCGDGGDGSSVGGGDGSSDDTGAQSGTTSGVTDSGVQTYGTAPTVDPGDYCANLAGADDNGDAEVGDVLTATVQIPGLDPATPTISGYWCYVTQNDDGTSSFSEIPNTRVALDVGSVYDDLTYALAAADRGHDVAFCFDVSADGYVTFSDSTDTATVWGVWKVESSRTGIDGQPKVGQVLVADLPTMSPPADDDLTTIQWYRDKKAISGAQGRTYKVVAADAGKKLRYALTLSLDGYADHAFTSTSVGPVKKAAKTDLSPAVPRISGKAKAGSTLTVVAGSWKPGGVALNVQWYAGNKAIGGATQKTLKLTKSYIGKYISVVVTGEKSKYTTTTAHSAPTKRVAK
jgi:hypothetical protein